MPNKTINDSIQQTLDVEDELFGDNSNGDVDFILKINEGHLTDLKISSISNLLSALGQMVGVDQANFKTIKEGSTTIAITVPNEIKHIALANLSKNTKFKDKQVNRIQKELKKYGYSNAEISIGKILEHQPYIPNKLLFTVFSEEIEEEFK